MFHNEYPYAYLAEAISVSVNFAQKQFYSYIFFCREYCFGVKPNSFLKLCPK
ncbi:hypothetical protein EV202_10315 [Bacteroides heparinolyticus]|uniref:Uncharacterized protein n=1 Tax=Prevotella heparinolytica TaxID=28113 RepID=A0A4R2M9Z2_9BACE|nr:hypothetical protein EV202_10315 [Bacteroides heparinolyticus]TWJ13617.1 hypothetical protein JN06_01870 [Bacteroides zoogleoformans]